MLDVQYPTGKILVWHFLYKNAHYFPILHMTKTWKCEHICMKSCNKGKVLKKYNFLLHNYCFMIVFS